MNDGKLESRARKCIERSSSVVYKKEKSPDFVISKNVTFESTMCNQRGGGISVVGNDQDVF